MSKGNATAAIRVTSKPKETTRVNYREADKDMHVNTYFGGFLGAKKRIPKAGKERNEADKGQGMTFRRGLAQVTTAFSDEAIKGKYGPSDVIGWFQPRSLALRGGGARRFRIKCGVRTPGETDLVLSRSCEFVTRFDGRPKCLP